MSRRTDRVDSLVRQTLGQLMLTKLSDPRFDPARVTITAVEVTEDMAMAKVHISVIGTEADQRKTLAALKHAAGHLQDLLMKEISLRQTPVLTFTLDTEFKKALETLEIIDQAMAEIRLKEQAQLADAAADADGVDADPREDA